MNARHPMGVLHSFSIKNIFYDKMDLRLFYFYLMTFTAQKHPPEVFCKERCSKGASTSLKKRLWHRPFPVNFAKF